MSHLHSPTHPISISIHVHTAFAHPRSTTSDGRVRGVLFVCGSLERRCIVAILRIWSVRSEVCRVSRMNGKIFFWQGHLVTVDGPRVLVLRVGGARMRDAFVIRWRGEAWFALAFAPEGNGSEDEQKQPTCKCQPGRQRSQQHVGASVPVKDRGCSARETPLRKTLGESLRSIVGVRVVLGVLASRSSPSGDSLDHSCKEEQYGSKAVEDESRSSLG